MQEPNDLGCADSLETVLLVDDNPVNLQVLLRVLSGSGYRLLTAENGEAAIDMAVKVTPSLILLDIIMPGMDGYQVCELLKSKPETEDVAVIFLSALEDSTAKVKGFSVGGVDYIAKPFQANEVIARVRNHIKIHRLERQLAKRHTELESEHHQILNAINEGIIGLDNSGRITLLNPAASSICGWSASHCLGARLHSLGLFETSDGSLLPEQQTLPYQSYRQGQVVQSDRMIIRRRDGQLVPVAIVCTPRPEGGAVIVLRDISERIESEQALSLAREELEVQRQNIAHIERLSTSGEMATGIAHEVNQPLTAIANYSRVLEGLLQQQMPDRDKLFELLGKITTQSERASAVIKRLRQFVKKPDAGRQLANANRLIREVIALAEVDSRINKIPIQFKPADSLPDISIDTVQIQQVVLNLVRNAMEAMAGTDAVEEGVWIKTFLRQQSLVVEVIDRGSGMSATEIDRIFDPFYTTKLQGMGIGLSICQSIIQEHGGSIGFRSNKPQAGSTFYFSLPLRH